MSSMKMPDMSIEARKRIDMAFEIHRKLNNLGYFFDPVYRPMPSVLLHYRDILFSKLQNLYDIVMDIDDLPKDLILHNDGFYDSFPSDNRFYSATAYSGDRIIWKKFDYLRNLIVWIQDFMLTGHKEKRIVIC